MLKHTHTLRKNNHSFNHTHTHTHQTIHTQPNLYVIATHTQVEMDTIAPQTPKNILDKMNTKQF